MLADLLESVGEVGLMAHTFEDLQLLHPALDERAAVVVQLVRPDEHASGPLIIRLAVGLESGRVAALHRKRCTNVW